MHNGKREKRLKFPRGTKKNLLKVVNPFFFFFYNEKVVTDGLIMYSFLLDWTTRRRNGTTRIQATVLVFGLLLGWLQDLERAHQRFIN